MRDRCRPNHTTRKYYAEKGIAVCEIWNDFAVFREWANSHGYDDTLTLDRIDNSKGYCPENCRWVTGLEQANNKTNNRMLEYNGKTQSMAKWARELNMNYNTLRSRLYRDGLTMQEAVEGRAVV